MKNFCSECDKFISSSEEIAFCKLRRHQLISMLEQNKITPSTSQTTSTTKQLKSRKKAKGMVENCYIESIIVDGKPRLLCNFLKENVVCIKDSLETGSEIIIPLEAKECGYHPYSFTGSEIISLIGEPISNDEILQDIKSQIDRFISLPELGKHLILGDLLLTYCQEWISTLHYPFFVGETESGKSSVLHLVKWLAYRCILGEDIPQADVYNFLGSDEEGAGTIAEDEAQELWNNREKIRTYKSSYAKGSSKARILGTDSLGKHQVFYKTFCPKWFAGERLPQDKGFVERLAVVHMSEGQPLSNIKRPSEDEKKQLNQLRNRLLVWKVQTIAKGIGKVDSGLKGRDQELWEDFLAVVHDTKYFDKCKNVVTYFIERRHYAIKNSFEAKIFKLVTDKLDNNLDLNAVGFWQYVTNNSELPGRLDHNTFYPDDFQKFSSTALAKLLEDKFQAEKRTRYEKDDGIKYHKITYYAFDAEVIKTLAKKYDTEIQLDNPIYSDTSSQSSEIEQESLDHSDDLDHNEEVPTSINKRISQ